METSSVAAPRRVVDLVTAHRQREGAGFVVRRPFPGQRLRIADPFLMLDELGPVEYGPGEAIGAPDHPHRGFETVSYLIEGATEHEDSAGHRGALGAGDVQWMTAGRGIVHSELPARELRERGGRMHGFQLWVNLPAAEKLIPPRYQEVRSDAMPTATTADGLATVKVIAGSALGVSARVETRIPIHYHDWRLAAGASVSLPIDAEQAVYVYVFGGHLLVADTPVEDGQLAVLGTGDTVKLSVPPESQSVARALLLAGKPLRERVVQYGPFVMNTEAQIRQAIEDYQSGRMGSISR